ncbi:GFA family protein [Mesorhizobium sp. YC-39]|uniref:GFA family protein n=1 Tax=unclassified Mesorhizobium TaxID=325217 RepID=UPI0021E99874|nr:MULTISPECIES: GFA family protein [unclassified Mesorhizobium]MCV3210900.1 GFA family protein [Mesorhizobium sp. YC-2]MCV3231134.1 GFA family protein [Mesorhizobium sp. YC-39]
MVTRRAECSCGQLSATCSGEPVRVSVCHCLACKRRTGSAFSFNARFPEDKVSIEGRAAQFTRIGEAGGRVTYSFCPDCGTNVHYRIDVQPGLIAIPVGAFADPSFPQPFQSFYHDSRRYQWVEVNAEPLATFG